MVLTTEVRDGHDAANPLNSRDPGASLFSDRCVRAVPLIRSQQLTKVPLAKRHDMIKALPSDRASVVPQA
jgi:hypothetical protein